MTQWRTVKIPTMMYHNVKEVIPWLGIPSVPEYIRTAVQKQLSRDEFAVEEMKRKMEEGEE